MNLRIFYDFFLLIDYITGKNGCIKNKKKYNQEAL